MIGCLSDRLLDAAEFVATVALLTVIATAVTIALFRAVVRLGE